MAKHPIKQPTPFEPHPLVLFTNHGSRSLAEKISTYIDIPLGEVDDEPFPNGECNVRLETEVRGRDVFVICSTCRLWDHQVQGRRYTGVNDNLMELLIFGDAISRASAWRVTAVVPYFGYARQDRKAASRTPITARLVADLLEASGFERVLTMDLHSPQIQGFFSSRCNLDHLNAGNLFATYFNSLDIKDGVVLSPDVGNLKKADRYRQGMPQFELAVIDKRRGTSGKNKGIEVKDLIGDVEGKTVILMDDIIATAGTMRGAIDFAEKKGAKEFYVAATHGEFVGDAIKNLSHPKVQKVVVTDTIPRSLSQSETGLSLEILSTGELFGEAIMRVHRKESVSELLGIYG